jgi:hypothetical protein
MVKPSTVKFIVGNTHARTGVALTITHPARDGNDDTRGTTGAISLKTASARAGLLI